MYLDQNLVSHWFICDVIHSKSVVKVKVENKLSHVVERSEKLESIVRNLNGIFSLLSVCVACTRCWQMKAQFYSHCQTIVPHELTCFFHPHKTLQCIIQQQSLEKTCANRLYGLMYGTISVRLFSIIKNNCVSTLQRRVEAKNTVKLNFIVKFIEHFYHLVGGKKCIFFFIRNNMKIVGSNSSRSGGSRTSERLCCAQFRYGKWAINITFTPLNIQ